jgi:hypothetical protein
VIHDGRPEKGMPARLVGPSTSPGDDDGSSNRTASSTNSGSSLGSTFSKIFTRRNFQSGPSSPTPAYSIRLAMRTPSQISLSKVFRPRCRSGCG